MKNPDDVIERVLAGLRKAEAPQGMERRILDAVEQRVAQRKRWIFANPAMGMQARPLLIATAGVVVVAIATSLTLHKRHEAKRDVAVVTTRQPVVTTPERSVRIEEARKNLPAPRRVLAALKCGKEDMAQPETISDEDALAISEMNAPSKPAPPLPLTHQERLLLRMIHKGDPVELAMLDPKYRSLAEATSRTQFDNFFKPTPAIVSTSPTTTDQPAIGENK